jgi:hypothetical protein
MLVAGIVLAFQQSGYLEHWELLANLESFNKDAWESIAEESPCRILLGESTVRLLQPDSYDIRRIGDVVLKGKEHTEGGCLPTHPTTESRS